MCQIYAALTKDGEYVITDAMKAELSEFFGAFGSEEETAVKIKEVYDKEGYVNGYTYSSQQRCI